MKRYYTIQYNWPNKFERGQMWENFISLMWLWKKRTTCGAHSPIFFRTYFNEDHQQIVEPRWFVFWWGVGLSIAWTTQVEELKQGEYYLAIKIQ